jgi:hypothetical protein
MPDSIQSDRLRELERAANRARLRRSRARKAGLLPPLPICPVCGGKVLQEATLPLCRICWRRTPEGKAAAVQRFKEWRSRKSLQACDHEA